MDLMKFRVTGANPMRATITVFWLLAFSLPASTQNRTAIDPEQTRILALETAWNRAEQEKDAKAQSTLISH